MRILLVCRIFCQEFLATLYSHLHYYILYRSRGNLKALRALNPSITTCLRDLTIVLSASSCDPRGACCRAPKAISHDCSRHDEPLDRSSLRYQSIYLEFARSIEHIAVHIAPFQLNLHLICDAADLETARDILQPLSDLPVLAGCNIRLGREKNPALEHFARQKATYATRKTPTNISCQAPFRFLDLPKEIRLRILESTDLITPNQEVTWNSKEGFYLHYDILRCGKDDCPPESHKTCWLRNCYMHLRNGCFCTRYHAAYSSICRCWHPPASLFSVCKAVRYEAQSVFFSRNRFVVKPPGRYDSPACESDHADASVFLQNTVPSDMLHYLRSLEFVFPPADSNYLSIESPVYKEWARTIEHVKEHLNQPALMIRVHFSDFMFPRWATKHGRSDLTREEGMEIVSMYQRILTPLSQLTKLGRFFIDAAWPWAWTRDGFNLINNNPDLVEIDKRQIEQGLEKLIMGDDYDGAAAGKADEEKSQWFKFLTHPYENFLMEARFMGEE